MQNICIWGFDAYLAWDKSGCTDCWPAQLFSCWNVPALRRLRPRKITHHLMKKFRILHALDVRCHGLGSCYTYNEQTNTGTGEEVFDGLVTKDGKSWKARMHPCARYLLHIAVGGVISRWIICLVLTIAKHDNTDFHIIWNMSVRWNVSNQARRNR